MSPNEVLQTDNGIIESLWSAMTMIEAQEQLKKLTVADWPNFKKSARKDMHKDLYGKAYPKYLKKKNYVTAEEAAKVLGR